MSALTYAATGVVTPGGPRKKFAGLSPEDNAATQKLTILGGLVLIAVLFLAHGTMHLQPMTCATEPVVKFGRDAAVAMIVRANHACTVAIRPGSVAVDRLILDRPPDHGFAQPRGATGFIYRPVHGFTGRDSFVFSVRGRSVVKGGTTTFCVAVKVI